MSRKAGLKSPAFLFKVVHPMLGLYLHIPFCLRKCHYCDFVITTQRSTQDRERFFRALEKEIVYARSQYGRLHFNTLYLGGGTPSELSGEEMKRLMALLRESFDFESDCETTCEMNPENADQERLEIYFQLGINRISLGVQAFQDRLLKDMGRSHSADDVAHVVRLLRKIGYKNISMDLICRLPDQTLQDMAESLKKILEFQPEQMTLYDLQVHPHTVYGVKQAGGELKLPDEEHHLQMVELAEERLVQAGYHHYEIANFAKPGFESRHNLIYWNNQEYLGLGPGAYSYLQGCRYQWAGSAASYLEKCEKGHWQPEVKDVLTEEEKEMETFLTGLRLTRGILLSQFKTIRNHLENKVQPFIELGHVAREGDLIRLTRSGRFLAENIMMELSLEKV